MSEYLVCCNDEGLTIVGATGLDVLNAGLFTGIFGFDSYCMRGTGEWYISRGNLIMFSLAFTADSKSNNFSVEVVFLRGLLLLLNCKRSSEADLTNVGPCGTVLEVTG